MGAGPVAAIDCGTNSTRLLITDSSRVPAERLMKITRLGQGVERSGALHPAAIERTLETLREYRAVLDCHGVHRLRMIATSAARDAANREAFLVPAQEVIGVPAELLSGKEEGELAFRGAVSELDPAQAPFLVVDIGGGSTELVLGTATPEAVRSLDVGCVRITERYLHGDPPAPEELSEALSELRDLLDDTIRQVPEMREAQTMVGLAGTVTTIAAVEMGLAAYDRNRIHHFVLNREAAEEVFRTLATEPRALRMHNPGLEKARADVIVGGATVLVAIMRALDLQSCLVSESDILDGIALGLLED